MNSRLLAAALCGLTLSGTAIALDYEWKGVEFSLHNKASAGLAVRTQDRDSRIIGVANGGTAFSTNGDDGNLAFDRGDIIGSAFKLTSDLTASYDDYGFFVRGSYLFDPTLNRKDYFDPADYSPNPQKEFGQDQRKAKDHAVRNHVGNDGSLLDAYVFANQAIAGHTLNLRLGQQTLNWGESVFILNGVNSLLAVDASRARVPGFELEELVRPAAMVWAGLDPIENVSVEGFYQLKWEPTIIDAAGTFFSTNDFAGIGGTQANLGFGRAGENADSSTTCAPPPPGGSQCVPVGSTVPRAPDRRPRNGGQYGGAVHFFIAPLRDMDLAFYGMNYHSRLPLVSGISRSGPGATPADTASYLVEYPEDIHLYGTSFNSTLPFFGIAIQGEYSYKQGQPLQIDDVELLLAGLGAASQINPTPGATLGNQYLRGWRRHNVSQVDLSVVKILGPHDLFSDLLHYEQMIVLAEVGLMHVNTLEPTSILRYDGPGTYAPGNAATAASQGLPQQVKGYPTATSWGYRTGARFSYHNVIGPLGLEPTLRFDQDVNGISPTPIANFVEGRKQLGLILGFKYLDAWTGDLGYTRYFGGGAQNLFSDRDFLEAVVKYSF